MSFSFPTFFFFVNIKICFHRPIIKTSHATQLPHSFYFEMSLIPLRLNLHDAIIFRTTNGERKRDNIVYTMELRWHENSRPISWAGVWRWLVRFGAPRHPEEVEEPFRETFRGLLPPLLPLPNWVKGRLGVGGAAVGVPLTLMGPWGSCGCGDCAGVPGLGSDEDVDGAPAGLPALSLAESLSGPDLLALFWPSCCAWLTFIFLQLGRTLYLSGNGPFCEEGLNKVILKY